LPEVPARFETGEAFVRTALFSIEVEDCAGRLNET